MLGKTLLKTVGKAKEVHKHHSKNLLLACLLSIYSSAFKVRQFSVFQVPSASFYWCCFEARHLKLTSPSSLGCHIFTFAFALYIFATILYMPMLRVSVTKALRVKALVSP